MVGEGAFGKVFSAELKEKNDMQFHEKINNSKVAIKIMQSSSLINKKLSNDLENELRVHWALRDCDGIL